MDNFNNLDKTNQDLLDITNVKLDNKNIDILTNVYNEKEENIIEEKDKQITVYSKQKSFKDDINDLIESPIIEKNETKDIVTEQNKNYEKKPFLESSSVLNDDLFVSSKSDIKTNKSNTLIEETIQNELNKSDDLIKTTQNIEKVCLEKQIEEDFKVMTEEEYLIAFNKSEMIELGKLESEINKRDIENRQYLNIENGEVVYSKEVNPSKRIIKDVKNNINKVTQKTKKGSKNIFNLYNKVIDDVVFRNRLLFIVLILFIAIFVSMFIKLTKEPTKNNQIISIHENVKDTINEDSIIKDKIIPTVSETEKQDKTEELISNSKNIKELEEGYLLQLFEINEDDIVSCIKNIDKKMNRLSLSNRIKHNLSKKEENFIIIRQNKDIFNNEEEIIVFNEIYNRTQDSINLSNEILISLDDGLNRDKLNNIINKYNVYNK